MDPITLILIALAVVFLVIVGIVLFRASRFAIQLPEDNPIPLDRVDGEEVARHIGLAIQMKTISNADPDKVDPLPFEGLRNLLKVLYPQVEDNLTREVINDGALLYTWQGTDPDLEPIALAAHQDVVPADETSDSGWSYPPFAGEVAEGYVWGRGALDCKGVLIG
ncbi:MAG TPA: M20/M25/M40 family metallo-hydrolase, partial [Anaerolineaceae bacterium]|nr:M20/M25/M40 family metallo-hydrolase [Anaerolineaceae bacterium]